MPFAMCSYSHPVAEMMTNQNTIPQQPVHSQLRLVYLEVSYLMA